MFKKSLIAAAFATVIVAPAFAQSYPGLNEAKVYSSTASDAKPSAKFTPSYPGLDQPKVYSSTASDAKPSAKRAYAQAPRAIGSRSDVVVSGGKVIGQDPDPVVRLMLLRDANAKDRE
jgi:hypothetical protein